MATYVVASKVKEYLKQQGCRTSGDAIEAVEQRLKEVLDAAARRAKGNKRGTVKAVDV
jgi:histone H3/H4